MLAVDSITSDSILAAYPRRVDPKAALRAIRKAMDRKPPEHILTRTKAYAKAVSGMEMQFIPHPATWFNNDRFDLTDAEWNPSGKRYSAPPPPPLPPIPEPPDWLARFARLRPNSIYANETRPWRSLPRMTQEDLTAVLADDASMPAPTQ